MKKVFKVFIATLGVILLLLIALPVIFRSKLEEAVKNKINQEIHATVDWTKFGLSFFRGFPDLSMSLHQVSVVGMAPFEGDTLVGLKRFELRVNPFSALKKELLVKTIRLDHPLVNGKVLEDGSMNWDVVQASSEDPSESPATEPSESSMSIALQNLIIHKGRIFYEDQASRTWATLEDFNLKLSGDFSKDLTQLDLRADVSKLNASQGGIRYLKDSQLAVDLLAEANMLENKYT